MDDPKDGLFLFGPIDDVAKPAQIRIGVIGRKEGIERYRRWARQINSFIPAERQEAVHHVAYPGFESIFGCKWPIDPICALEIASSEIDNTLRISQRHEALYKTVGLFTDSIFQYLREQEANVDLWFVVIPEDVYRYGRPKSIVPPQLRVASNLMVTKKRAQELQRQPSFFPEDMQEAELYKYEVHFHNQLKARLLGNRAVIQIARETTLTPDDFQKGGRPIRRLQDPATLAWNLTTTCYFKASGRPWKLANVRDGVCYVGIVFKHDMTSLEKGNACCGAQMFLDSGDGLVFRGAVGPWYSETRKEFHLRKDRASELIKTVVDAYSKDHGHHPRELFIHGKTRFDDEEWQGFLDAVPQGTTLVGIRIRDEREMKLYSQGKSAVLRGTAYFYTNRRGYLWTRGYIPRLRTYSGREVPNPLSIEICRGEASLEQVMSDIMGLTKLNFNACIYADGLPVTLRFADEVGEILTSTPLTQELPPLPFKHYI